MVPNISFYIGTFHQHITVILQNNLDTVTCLNFDFADVLLQLRVTLEEMEKKREANCAIGTIIKIEYEGW